MKALYVPAADMAKELGFTAAANMIVLAVYMHVSGVLGIETLKQIIPLSIKRKQYVDVNLEAVDMRSATSVRCDRNRPADRQGAVETPNPS